MADTNTTVTSVSWISRLLGSIVGVLVGVVLVFAALGVLYWNEGRAVRTSASLLTGSRDVVNADPNTVDTANEGRLVHVTGQAATTELLSDATFGIAVRGIRFTRKAELYQWREDAKSETRNKTGGGTETATTYSYTQAWSPTLIDSSRFHESAGHTNPTTMPVAGESWAAQKVTLGGFTLSQDQVDKLDQTQEIAVEGGHPVPAGFTVDDGRYYRGANPAAPAVGDERISFEVVSPATISVVARQVDHSFEADRSGASPIMLLTYGTASADEMFKTAESENKTLAWILRGAGFVVMLIGLALIFRPLVVVADVVPLIGSLLNAGTFAVAFFLALSLSSLTIGLAWVRYRPWLGVPLLLTTIAAIALLHRFGVERKASRA